RARPPVGGPANAFDLALGLAAQAGAASAVKAMAGTSATNAGGGLRMRSSLGDAADKGVAVRDDWGSSLGTDRTVGACVSGSDRRCGYTAGRLRFRLRSSKPPATISAAPAARP